MEDKIAGQLGSEAVPASPVGGGVGVPSEAEQTFNREIRQLRDAHHEALAAAQRNKDEAQRILHELGKRLSGAKGRLARPGRNGGWSSFARSLGFSRAEADGLVRRYRRTLKPRAACTTVAEAATVSNEGEPAAAAAEARPEAAGEVEVVSALETDQASHPSEEASAIAVEPAVEAAATSTGDGQTAEPATEVLDTDAPPVPTEPGVAAADAASGAVA